MKRMTAALLLTKSVLSMEQYKKIKAEWPGFEGSLISKRYGPTQRGPIHKVLQEAEEHFEQEEEVKKEREKVRKEDALNDIALKRRQIQAVGLGELSDSQRRLTTEMDKKLEKAQQALNAELKVTNDQLDDELKQKNEMNDQLDVDLKQKKETNEQLDAELKQKNEELKALKAALKSGSSRVVPSLLMMFVGGIMLFL